MAKILILEDDEATARAVAQALQQQGHLCSIQTRAKGAAELARHQRPDLIVVSVMLPDVCGFEVCRSIRRDPDLYMMPVLIMSSMREAEEVEHGLAQGADVYVTKPFEMRDLVQRIEVLIAENEAKEHLDAQASLPDTYCVRRELQRRICIRHSFSLIYVELLNLRSFGKAAGAEGRDKSIRHVARALSQCGSDFFGDAFFVGHMGGGHYMCVTPVDKVREFCLKVEKAWTNHLETFYESAGQGQAYRDTMGRKAGDGVLSLAFYVTTRQSKERSSSQQLMDVVSRIRNHSDNISAGGIRMDRRAYSPETAAANTEKA